MLFPVNVKADPATYTLLPETAIAVAFELVAPLGKGKAVTVAVELPEAICHSSATEFPVEEEVNPAM